MNKSHRIKRILFSLAFTLLALSVNAFDHYATCSNQIVKIETFSDSGIPIKQGSGIVMGKSELREPPIRSSFNILTNFHVVEFAHTILITTKKGEYSLAGVVFFDAKKDIAIIRNRQDLDVKPASFRNVTEGIGKKAYSISSPQDLGWSLSDGIISQTREVEKVDYLQFTPSISHGSSGGGLFDANGICIGLITSSMEKGQNLNLAITLKNTFIVQLMDLCKYVGNARLNYSDWNGVKGTPKNP